MYNSYCIVVQCSSPESLIFTFPACITHTHAYEGEVGVAHRGRGVEREREKFKAVV